MSFAVLQITYSTTGSRNISTVCSTVFTRFPNNTIPRPFNLLNWAEGGAVFFPFLGEHLHLWKFSFSLQLRKQNQALQEKLWSWAIAKFSQLQQLNLKSSQIQQVSLVSCGKRKLLSVCKLYVPALVDEIFPHDSEDSLWSTLITWSFARRNTRSTCVPDRNLCAPKAVDTPLTFIESGLAACPASRYIAMNEQLPFRKQKGKNSARCAWKEAVRKDHKACWLYKLWPQLLCTHTALAGLRKTSADT